MKCMEIRESAISSKITNPIYDMLDFIVNLGLFSTIKGISEGPFYLMGNRTWNKLLWDNAWVFEDGYRKSTIVLY